MWPSDQVRLESKVMESTDILDLVLLHLLTGLIFLGSYKLSRYAFAINTLLLSGCLTILYYVAPDALGFARTLLIVGCPLLLVNTVLYVFLHKEDDIGATAEKYRVRFRLKRGKLEIANIKRGASVIGSAGSGKTESVV